ncbi:hypothetical protein J2Z64_002790 [Oceanobacillus polygoni]|uniref:Uncharacterized protein n=1 Tax=Oceanobacillus polygoni TaxID=1235259 RepID=A0A9X0YWW2_9BACI|nr:hypothetical protein [Oceanobacillus polygoni]
MEHAFSISSRCLTSQAQVIWIILTYDILVAKFRLN